MFIFFKSAGYFSFDFAGQYARRALAREVFAAGSANGYLSSIGTQAFFPVLFAWGSTDDNGSTWSWVLSMH